MVKQKENKAAGESFAAKLVLTGLGMSRRLVCAPRS